MKLSRRGRKGKSSISFSIAGIRAASKPRPHPHPPARPHPHPHPPAVSPATNNNHNNNNTSRLSFPLDDTESASASAAQQAETSPRQKSASPKYPGRGKLTILKKGNATTKSIIKRVPVANNLYDSSDNSSGDEAEGDSSSSCQSAHLRSLLLQDDESILLDALDAEITKAEEKELVNKLDEEILLAEEADLMRRLLINIHHAAYLENCNAKPSVVMKHPEVEDWLMPRHFPPPPSSQDSEVAFLPTWGKPPQQEGLQEMAYIQFGKVTKALPKYVDQEHTILAFTIPEFHTGVILKVENEIRAEDPTMLVGWDACLKKRDPSDPFSYLLEAHGPKQALDLLKNRTELWIQSRINLINCHLLLQDGESVVLDIFVESKVISPLGYANRSIKFSDKQIPLRYGNFGVWLSRVKRNTTLATAMGGPQVYESGCAILAVNGRDCNKPDEFRQLYEKARHGKGVKLTLCLSKFADFNSIPDLSLMSPRRLDGKAFDKDRYAELCLEKLEPMEVASESFETPSYMEYPPAGSPEPPLLPRKLPVTAKEKDRAIMDVLANENNVEIDIEVSASDPLGAVSHEPTIADAVGLWIHDFKENGQLFRTLGKNACKYGLVLFKANGMVIQPGKQADGKINSARAEFTQIKQNAKGGGGTFRVTVVMHDGTDLSGIQKSKLVRGRVNPRRRNLVHYALNLLPLQGIDDTVSKTESSSDDDGVTLAVVFGGKKKKEKEDNCAAKNKKTQNKEKKQPSTSASQKTSKETTKTTTGSQANSKNKPKEITETANVDSHSDDGLIGKAKKVLKRRNKRSAVDPLSDSDDSTSGGKRKPKRLAKKKSKSTHDRLREEDEDDSLTPLKEKPTRIPRKKRSLQSNNLAASVPKKARTIETAIPGKEARSNDVEVSIAKKASATDVVIPRKKAQPGHPRNSLSTVQAPHASDKQNQDPAPPRSAYMEFAHSRRDDVKEQNPGTTQSEVENILRTMWGNAPELIKLIYRDKEAAAKNKHQTEVQETVGRSEVGAPTPPAHRARTATVTNQTTTPVASVGESASQPPKVSRKRKVLIYGNFKRAYKPLVGIEYGSRAKINSHKVFSGMWAKHKQLMGEDSECDSTCACFTKIQEMTEHVIDNYVEDQKAKNQPVESAPVTLTLGFVNHFVPRFYGLLSKQYPSESAKQLMQRLVKMWPAHQKHRMYGVQCHASCECEGGWELVFGKGDPETVARNRKQKQGSITGHTDEPSTQKQKASTATMMGEGSRSTSAHQQPIPGVIPRKSSTGSTLLQKYEVVFEPHRELMGAFFATEQGKCKIISLFKKGKARRDPRIQPGTIAVAVRIGVLEYPITSHDDLRVQYFRARSSGLKLHVIFINSEVTTRPFDANADKDWSENGRWNNRIERGWAGGAKTKKGIAAQQKSVQANRNAAHLSNDVPTVEFNNGETSSSVDTAGAQTIDDTSEVTWVSTTTKISPQHRTLARSLEGIRKEASGPRGNPRSVKFTTSETTKHFVFGTPAAEWVVPSHTIPRITPAHKHRERELSPEDAVKDAVQKHQYQKLIQVLEDGASTNYDVLKNIKEQHDFVKNTLKSVEAMKSGSSTSGEKEQANDLKAKRVVLNIYDNVCHYIEQAMTLQHLSNFEIRIKSIELHKKPNCDTVGRTSLLTGRVTLKRGSRNEELGSLPQRNTTEFVNYDDEEKKIFMAHNNSRCTLEKRSLVIAFREGAQQDAVPSAKLGTIAIPLNTIEELCLPEQPYILREEISAGSTLAKGTIEIEFKRRRVERDYIIREKESLVKQMNEQIGFIQRFNKEHSDEAASKLTANIRYTANTSFLHAAIELHEERMVQRLLELDANPHEKSSVYGTPITLAMQYRDRVREKLQRHINKGESDTVTEKQHDLHYLFTRIFQLLKPQESSAQLPDDIARTLEEDLEADDRVVESAEDREQLQIDFDIFNIFKEIFDRVPATAGGTDDQLEANKAYVGSSLRLYYKRQCPTRDAMRAFLEKAISNKLVVPISNTKLRLGNIGHGARVESRNELPDLPLPDTKKDWLHRPKALCRGFTAPRGCKHGYRCRFVHIHRGNTNQKDADLVFAAKDLLSSPYRFEMDERCLETLTVRGWCTAGYFHQQKNKYFYAEGMNGKANRQAVYWYPTLNEAKEAIARVLSASMLTLSDIRSLLSHQSTQSLSNPEQSVSSRDSALHVPSSQQDGTLPTVDDKDWMESSANFQRCPKGDMPKACPQKARNNCRYWHVHEPFGNMMGHNMIKVFLDPDDVYPLERNGFHTAAYSDRRKRFIIYAEGGNSRRNYQGVHWYNSDSAARIALERVVSAARVEKG